jgi:thymidine kinase
MAKLYFYYSTMNAGKSTALLQSSHNYRERGMRTLVYTAKLDVRGGGKVHSRIGLEGEARWFEPGSDLYAEIAAEHAAAALSCVLLDEAQFLDPAQVRQLSGVVDQLGVPVLCYGLRTDFRGELFPGSARLLAIADELSELKTICHCGRKATMVVRVGADGTVERHGAQIEIGGNERYVPLCRRHFHEVRGEQLPARDARG